MAHVQSEKSSRFAVCSVGPYLVGIPAKAVEEMFVLPTIHAVPGAPAHRRGLATFRGSALSAVDLRVCLGLASASSNLDALIALLRDREQDHVSWLAELEACAREKRTFGLAMDPRKCKFGQWYYSFQADDAVLRGELAKIEQPHATIHALAGQVEALKTAGQFQQALDVIDTAKRGVLAEVLYCFDQIRRAMRAQHREIGVAAALGEARSVLIVDRAEAVADLEQIADGDDPLTSGELRIDLVAKLARWSGARDPVFLLDMERVAALAVSPKA